MGKIIIVVVLVIIVLAFLTLYFMNKEAFKQTEFKKRKDKNMAFVALEKINMLDKKIYNDEKIEEVTIKSKDNYNLKGYFIEKYKQSNKYVILIHGYSCNHYSSMAFARMFLNKGFNVLAVDSRSHGESEGIYATYGYYEKDDINLWIEEIKKRINKDELFLGLHGQSMGASTSLIVGGNNKDVKFVIDDCGFSRAKDCIKFTIGKHKYVPINIIYKCLNKKLIRLAKFNLEESNPIDEIVKRKDLPVLFVHGMKDEKVPYKMAEEMYNKKQGKNDILFLVKDAVHMNCYGVAKKEYEEKVYKIIELAEEIYKKRVSI